MNKKSIDLETLRIFWQTGLKANRRYFWLMFLYPLGQICIYMVAPLAIGRMLASLTVANGNPWQYLPFFLVAALLGVIFNKYGFANLLRYQAQTMARLQTLALETLLKRSAGFHNNNIGGKLVSDAIDYPAAYSLLSNAFSMNLLPFFIVLVAGTILVSINSWLMGLVIAVMAAFTLGSGILESRKRSPLRAARLKVTKAVTGHLADTVVNVPTVKAFARESKELSVHRRLNNQLLNMRLKDWISAGNSGNRRIAMLFALQLLFVATVVHQVQNDPSLLALGIFGFSFSIMLSNRLFEVNILVRNIEDGLLQAEPLTQIIMQDVEVTDMPGAPKLKVSKGRIDIKNVDFHYRDNENSQKVFKGLNLSIAPGERVGLVGPSGGGKSTLTRLLLRFDDLDSGQITIDGQGIESITQESLRQNISYVPQEPLMFHRSVRENIAYAQPDATDKAVQAAARAAHADKFINSLPGGYQTIVGERGVKLSGGQRQRVAIARAILKDAPILILDEATSALDSESEVLIQDALWKLMQGRTAIVIAHRLSTIQKMDRIVVLDNGVIVEQGTHKQLLQNKGLYARLWKHQSGGFIEQ